MFQVTIWSVPPLLAALVGVGTYLRLADKKRVPGIHAILTLLAAMLFWSGAQFVGSLFTDPGIKLIAAKFAYFGIVLTPVAWLVFAVGYTSRQLRMSAWALNGICLLPFVTLVLVVTNEWHQLIWTGARLVTADAFVGLEMSYGPWFWVHAAYSYLLTVVATTILAYAIYQTTGEMKPVIAVVLAPLVVVLGNLFYISPINPVPWFDMTTVAFAAGAMILDVGVLRHGVLDSIPVLRDRVVEQLSDGVVVVDHDGCIIDINASALDILETTRSRLHHTPITEFIRSVPLASLLGAQRKSLEVTLRQRAYDVSASQLDSTNPQGDFVLVFRDVTRRRKAEQDLRDAQGELVRLAHTDSLTGLHNRRFFMQRLQEEVERVRRHGNSLSVLLFDLDYFKRINDTYGHDTGDRILQAVADASSEIKRITDVAARIGGEEFALLLPETDADGALQLAHRLRQSIEQIPTTGLTGEDTEVTASVGVATVSYIDGAADSVLRLADEALYQAKDAGRNQVRCADVPPRRGAPLVLHDAR